jgi:hypothetical protein
MLVSNLWEAGTNLLVGGIYTRGTSLMVGSVYIGGGGVRVEGESGKIRVRLFLWRSFEPLIFVSFLRVTMMDRVMIHFSPVTTI